MALCWKTHWYFTTLPSTWQRFWFSPSSTGLGLGQLSIQKGFITLVQIYYLSNTSSTKSTCLFAGLQHIQQCRWLNCFHVLIKTKSENGFHNKHVNPQPLSREPSIISLANSSFLSLERTFINHCFMKILKYSQRSQLLDLTFKQFVEKYLAWIQSKTIKAFLRTRFNDFRQGSNKIKIVLFVD